MAEQSRSGDSERAEDKTEPLAETPSRSIILLYYCFSLPAIYPPVQCHHIVAMRRHHTFVILSQAAIDSYVPVRHDTDAKDC